MRMHRRGLREAPPRYDAASAAAELAAYLQTGGALAPIPVHGLELDPGEVAYADVECTTARFYAAAAVYPKAGAGYYEDHPVFGRRWVPNHRLDARRRQQAEAEAAARWRDQARARLVLTSEGLRINPAGTWLPFDHALLTQVSSAPARHELVLSYSVCEPVLLSGEPVPWLAVALRSLLPAEQLSIFSEN